MAPCPGGRSDIPSQDECTESLNVPPLSQIRFRDANHITAGVYTVIQRPVRKSYIAICMLSTKCAGCAIRCIFENFLSLIKEHFRAWVMDRISRHQSVSKHRSCKRFVTFLASEILKQKAIWLLRVWGRVGFNESPYLVMHTVEPISYPEPTLLLVSAVKQQAVNLTVFSEHLISAKLHQLGVKWQFTLCQY